MDEKWIYYGIFFSDTTKKDLLEYTKKLLAQSDTIIPENWKIYCDHVTLVFNNKTKDAQEMANYYENNLLGKSVALKVTHLGISDRAIALEVDYQTANKHSHVTIAIAPDAKPVESNDITHWIAVDTPFYMRGKIDKFVKS